MKANEPLTNHTTKVFNITTLILYILANLVISHYHEAWRDEAQAWVLVKNSILPEIFGLCASEGHPCLWFLFLYPFTRLGFSFYHFSLISIVLMSISAFLWLFKSPFSCPVKLLVLISPLFFYYNPVICRTYSLLMILLMLICILWKNREQHPVYYGVLVALLFQCHILVAGMAIGFLIDMIIHIKSPESKVSPKHIIGILMSFSSMIILYFELKQHSYTETFLKINASSILRNLNVEHIFKVMRSYAYKFGHKAGWLTLFCIIVFFTYIFFVYIYNSSLRNDFKNEFIVLLSSLIVYSGICFLIRKPDHTQIALVLWMFIIFTCWQYSETNAKILQKKICIGLFVCICILSMPNMYNDIIHDINKPFSGGKAISAQIIDNASPGSTIVLKCNTYNTVIYAYLSESGKYHLWDIENDREFTIHKWGQKKPHPFSDSEVPAAIRKKFGKRDDIYYVSNSKLKSSSNYLPIASVVCTDNKKESFWLYRITN